MLKLTARIFLVMSSLLRNTVFELLRFSVAVDNDVTLTEANFTSEIKLKNMSAQCRRIMQPSAWSCATLTLTFDFWN